LRCGGGGQPSPVLNASSRCRRSRRSGSYSATPGESSSPLILFTCRTRSFVNTFSLTAKTPAVLRLGSRRFDHHAHARLPRLDASRALKSVSPSIPSVLARRPPARCRNRSGIDNVAFNSFNLQSPVNPEAVQPRFLHDDDRSHFPGPRQSPPLEVRKARQQRADVSGRRTVL